MMTTKKHLKKRIVCLYVFAGATSKCFYLFFSLICCKQYRNRRLLITALGNLYNIMCDNYLVITINHTYIILHMRIIIVSMRIDCHKNVAKEQVDIKTNFFSIVYSY